jgi:nucleoside-diphosphate-sugar epimerase
VKVFVLGATGFLGSSVARRLIANGDEVVGFVRSEEAARRVPAGVEPWLGDVADLEGLSSQAMLAEATVFAPQLPSQEAEYETVRALLKSYRGTDKAFIFTSGTGVVGQRTFGEWSEDTFAEDDDFVPSKYILQRRFTEIATRAAAQDGVRAMVIRPPALWSETYHGFVDNILTSIDKTGAACFIGKGLNLYSHSHVEDVADLYAAALDRGAAGALYHCAAAELNNRTLAELVARQQGVETRSISTDEAIEIWGKFNTLVVMGVSSRTRSPRSRKELGWNPTRVDLASDILAGKLLERRH